MDNLILSDKTLNQQVCAECMNYLSVGPVMVSREEKILCGRCSPDKQSALKGLNHSLYNLVAEKLVFRCINYYEGCEELLNFNEAVEHEKNCKRGGFKCPFCDYEGNGCQLVHHFDRDHPEYVVKEYAFKIVFKETFSKNLIFVKKNIIFCLSASMKCTFIEFVDLLISPINLGPKRFKLRFFKSDTNIEFVTGSMQIAHESGNFPSSSSLKNNIECDTNSTQIKNSFLLHESLLLECFPSGWCFCKIELIDEYHYDDMEKQLLNMKYLEKIKKTDSKSSNDIVEMNVVKDVNEENSDINGVLKMSRSDLRKFVNNELYSLQNCVNCKKYITSVVYFCPKYHMACKECSESECVKCDKFCIWSIKPKLNISLPCEWNNCSDCPNIFKYTTHKRDCVMRRYKCPDVDCEFEGCLVELKKHWHVNPIFYCNSLEFETKNRSLFWHVTDHHEMFYVSVKYDSKYKKLRITVKQVDVAMPKNYKFLLEHSRDFNNYQSTDTKKMIVNGFVEFNIIHAKLEYSFKLSCFSL